MTPFESFSSVLQQESGPFPQLHEGQTHRLFQHYELMTRWNQVLNLTSITDLEQIVVRHYCESLFLANHLPARSLRILDIGSGPGFPGFPISIVRPDCSVTLAESHQRKAVFLKEAARSIPNLAVLAKRSSDIREEFDWVVSRAVRWQDIAKDVHKLTSNVALLMGETDAKEAGAAGSGFAWNTPARLPWGKGRILMIGRVPRGTLVSS